MQMEVCLHWLLGCSTAETSSRLSHYVHARMLHAGYTPFVIKLSRLLVKPRRNTMLLQNSPTISSSCRMKPQQTMKVVMVVLSNWLGLVLCPWRGFRFWLGLASSLSSGFEKLLCMNISSLMRSAMYCYMILALREKMYILISLSCQRKRTATRSFSSASYL